MGESLLAAALRAVGPEAVYAAIPEGAREQLRYEWRAWARPEQLPPDGDWLYWLIMAGRSFGKTRAGAEWVRQFAFDNPGCRIALIGRTAADVRNTMLEGPSGLLSISPPWFEPVHEPSKTKLTWPNGSVALTFSAEEPESIRGPQFHAAWCDELAAWPTYSKDNDGKPGIPRAWTQLSFVMRLPDVRPRVCVTTTPKASKVIRALVLDAQTVVTKGSTFDNAANLAPEYIARMRSEWEGTRLGRQELYAEILDDVEGALWSHDLIDRARIKAGEEPRDFRRIVVAVDPSGSAKAEADEAGIVCAAVAPCRCKGREELHGFVLEDVSGRYSPADMGQKAVDLYHTRGADRLVAEDNFGGKIVEDLMRLIDRRVAYHAVHASRGKIVRAEPVAALYEQGKVHHVGAFDKLEDELCGYTPSSSTSPGRMDALVWALTDLMLGQARASFGGTDFRPSGRMF